ncbi:hypothetical protein GLOIN_2v1778720 [Rhizophagus irregularis DAOM 181602=DAOM 197198]|uniref:Uncharacterized protein n=2 Tax=Rhizophagus irregularis TaxID=588596 RepID=A0A2N1NJR5_9GLOM|nr:hypothetical protein GLOIN_2v1778720 [Rhizophagus irregularis DAOM 181602=DAOM 197198]PKK74157.1 hypothetical protein RhiirC2_775120 [Rhizophagus irregularis]POG68021.1 hypothetical protein GLOIN_2v1778720 [Rhizophagus irregularis DAOM 181602=DAOM 197198]GBC14167.2 hypothetical protein GLOIN_2v1778720 [Rhizophagus irregularis DAOM 181602=DAOM 197198]|eukprot:XP_025174887.1 hypothetical protein GLOIN_2v1778720 [Rhizophagus irregularis DAOM 181602=DAOM 197198]
MSFTKQSTDSLRELNVKLLAEIAKLRKENAELREKLLLKFARSDELEKTIADYSVKISKLNAVIVELEKTNAVTAKLENVDLKAEIAKLSQRCWQR